MKASRSLLDFIVSRGSFDIRKVKLPFHDRVEIYQDRYGIPHVYGADDHDLAMALGLLHARDRLWQMDAIRRLAGGNLSEIVGPATVDIDHWTRLLGLPRLRDLAAASASGPTLDVLKAYVEGINGFIETAGKHLPLEYRARNIVPAPWTVKDLAAPLAYNAWNLQTNFTQEKLAVLARWNLTDRLWKELFPPYSEQGNMVNRFFEEYGKLTFGNFIRATTSMSPDTAKSTGGSNNWAVRYSADGAPLLANDPHLGVTVPPIWYFAHLDSPGLHVAGAFMPGNPLMILGRNKTVGWGVTNVMTDCADLVAFRVDPSNPTQYLVNGEKRDMRVITEKIDVAGEGTRDVEIFTTLHGPVITEIKRGVEAVIALKWYGTLPEGIMTDSSVRGFYDINHSSTVEEALTAGHSIEMVGQNFVAADVDGNIGWRASGQPPIRNGYSGITPADGSGGEGEWSGFVPATEMPMKINPPEGRIATANNRTVGDEYEYHITDAWCEPYRVDRITELLSADEDRSSVDSFESIQLDVLSRRARLLVPGIVNNGFTDPDASMASNMLSSWDFTVTARSAPALVYEVFQAKFTELLLEPLLGRGVPVFLKLIGHMSNCVDGILDPSQDTADFSGILNGRQPHEIIETALRDTVKVIRDTCGRNPRRWSWGSFHRYMFRHPGATGRISSWLLNRGPYEAGGDSDTANVSIPRLANRTNDPDQYEVRHIPSMRFVTSMAGIDTNYIVGPMGQSGRPGSRHYADMMPLYLAGKYIHVPMSRRLVESIAIRHIVIGKA